MRNYTFKIFFIALLGLTLSGCLSFGQLKYSQVKMLKKEGFILTNEGWSLGLPERLLFDFDHVQIKSNYQQELSHLATQLNKYNLHKLKIIGHTDNTGDPNYNQKLSKERAQSVATFFIYHGFKRDDLVVLGRGATQPFLPNTSIKNRANNRRVSIIIIP